MSRPRGGIIGNSVAPMAATVNSAASGVWTLRDAEALKRAGTWPCIAPAQISQSLRAWLDASDESTLFSDIAGATLATAEQGVALWRDKSGNGWNATQSNSGDMPTRKVAFRNGLGSLLFDGSTDSMAFASGFSSFGSDDFSFVVACVTGGSVSGIQNILSSQNQTNGGPVFRLEINGGQWSAALRYQGRNAFDVRTASVATSTGYVLSLIKSGGSVTIKSGANSASASDTNTTLNLNPPLQVGRALFSTGESQWHFNGQIPEIIAYSRAISADERTSLESYLASKWGIS